MIKNIEYNIFERMKKAKRGVVFFASDFVVYGNSNTCSKALERLTKDGKITRVARGIYTIPRKSKYFGRLTPSLEAIAEAIARRDKARIIPTGLFAENALGLSTQIPTKAVYLTDGTPRKIIIGDRTLLFKRTAPKNVAAWGKISGLAIQALKSIGKEKITNDDVEKIVAALKQESKENLANDIKLAPDWIRKIMRKAQTSNNI
ncbi:MAG: type IV toxin-antitoxin system AbiEi family antitoxin domain-containing protein [Prevotellaceae bacterium]|jgi:hypothetical protein|nr:type IV toxin-antitoxin system AbiEi family antitoxin domain-containing protein [Prevotellaceae bacterium]